jgi:hypothetical protein
VNHAAAVHVNEKVPITWVQIVPLRAIPIHSQRLERKIGGNFRLVMHAHGAAAFLDWVHAMSTVRAA